MIGIAARPTSFALPPTKAERAAWLALFRDEQTSSGRAQSHSPQVGPISKANRIEEVTGQREQLG